MIRDTLTNIRFRAWDEEQNKMLSFEDLQNMSISILKDSKMRFMLELHFHDIEGALFHIGDIVAKIDKIPTEEMNNLLTDMPENYSEIYNELYYALPYEVVKLDIVELAHSTLWLKDESFGYEGEGLAFPKDWLIVGNIYENPEMIKSELFYSNRSN